jgi:hypothetical protein
MVSSPLAPVGARPVLHRWAPHASCHDIETHTRLMSTRRIRSGRTSLSLGDTEMTMAIPSMTKSIPRGARPIQPRHTLRVQQATAAPKHTTRSRGSWLVHRLTRRLDVVPALGRISWVCMSSIVRKAIRARTWYLSMGLAAVASRHGQRIAISNTFGL